MLILGNDIVDLQAVTKDKHLDARFCARVLTVLEQQRVAEAMCPEKMLWLHWAAKEAAYKIAMKLDNSVVFNLKKFQVVSVKQTGALAKVKVKFERQTFNLNADIGADKIHVSGYYSRDPIALEYIFVASKMAAFERKKWQNQAEMQEHFSCHERTAIYHPAAAAVRMAIKAKLANMLGVMKEQLEIIRKSRQGKMLPPKVLHTGKSCDVDLTISHHGSWWAYGVYVPARLAG